ncbi:FliM/FliN family flagellar motor switch protein [Dickeya dianthicola]|uniref:FliM/FliN family flagellar motor switch protein n=1 Tax=Dickeya dianthicola TaxID=204039 RepID=UPI001F6139F2|nr:FliM/FliN family flagellar motor switch protein [Dickeya dianthicola]MCI4185278.1 FliM/FliN family flagellar motor switch protein [Dickeya dianthicola]
MTPLARMLRPVSQARAALSRQLATAHRFAFMLDGQPGELRLRLADDAPPGGQESRWRCHAGTLWLDDNAAPLLSLLSACPALTPGPDDTAETADWYWTQYNHHLSPALRELFGEIRPALSPQPEHDEHDDLTLWLEVIRGDFRVRSRLRTSTHALQRWQSQPGWYAPRYPLPGHLAIRVPLTLADVTLSYEQLATLEPGDLICPLKQYFSPQGNGCITLADRRLTGQLRMDALAPYWFTVTALEECPVTIPFDDASFGGNGAIPFGDAASFGGNDAIPFGDAASFDGNGAIPFADAASVEAYAAPEADFAALDGDNHTGAPSGYALPPLMLALTVRCGYLTLTLQDLQQLAPGTVLTLQQATPGEAALYHGEQPLALGELVDVEGRLGLQITRRLGVDGDLALESSR